MIFVLTPLFPKADFRLRSVLLNLKQSILTQIKISIHKSLLEDSINFFITLIIPINPRILHQSGTKPIL